VELLAEGHEGHPGVLESNGAFPPEMSEGAALRISLKPKQDEVALDYVLCLDPSL
jgi:hypothetical protein